MVISRDKIAAIEDMAIVGATGKGFGIGRYTCQWLMEHNYATRKLVKNHRTSWHVFHITPKGMKLFRRLKEAGAFEWVRSRTPFTMQQFYRTRRAMSIEV